MLHEKPDVERLLSFIARCRQSDGSYASARRHWRSGGQLHGHDRHVLAAAALGLASVVETVGFTPLVNGKGLAGWEGDVRFWSVKDRVLYGRSPGLDHNEFLSTTGSYGDYNLSLYFRVVDGKGNSGVQFRSIRIPNHEMSGYQADLGDGYWGSLYDESRRNKVLVAASNEALAALNKTDWNHYVIRAMGDKIELYINGKKSVDYREPDASVARSGLLAVQIHAGGPMEVQFKDAMIQPLPIPTAGNSTQPGFHLRTLKTDQGERKYASMCPRVMTATKCFR